ncbi:MAG: hypothetical protein QNJ36_19530 [Calothrix sp. MO_167.B42]|nr:hypothetical protein [Calothrix sp. MO_167.B42]
MKLIKSTLYLQAGLQILTRLVFSVLMLTLSIAPDAAYAKSTDESTDESADICTLTQINHGELVGESKTLPTKLVSLSSNGGSPTQVSLTCNQPTQLTVSHPIQISGPKFTPVSSFATVETPFRSSTNSGDSSPLSLPVGTTNLVINFSVDKGSPLPAGNYRYGVKFTILPQ